MSFLGIFTLAPSYGLIWDFLYSPSAKKGRKGRKEGRKEGREGRKGGKGKEGKERNNRVSYAVSNTHTLLSIKHISHWVNHNPDNLPPFSFPIVLFVGRFVAG